MPLRKVTDMEDAWMELVFSSNALGLDGLTKDLVTGVEPHFVTWEDVGKKHRLVLRGELHAQAVFGDVNYRADAGVIDFSKDIERAAGNQDSPRFKRYFVMAPSRLVRGALGAMAERIKGWIEGIKLEPEPAVKAHAGPLDKLADEAQATINGVATAEGATTTFRRRVVEDFLDEVDAFRMDLQGELQKRAAKHKLGPEWVAKFFRPARRRARRGPADEDGDETPPAK